MLRTPFSLRHALLGAATLSLTGLSALHAAGTAAADSTVIARVGDTEVTAGDIRNAIANLDAKTQAAATHDSSSLSQVVRALLTQRLVLKEALAKKWDENPVVTAAIDRLKESAIEQTYLQSVSAPDKSYPADSEVQTAYDNNKDKFLVPRQFRIAQIFVKDVKGADSATDSKAQVKLDSVKKSLAKKDADYAAVARAESDEPDSAAKDGELGWIVETRIQPEIRTQIGSLKKGGVSSPIRLDDGWHIIKVLDIKEPYTAKLDEIKPQIVQEMRAERTRANSQQYIANLIKDNPVQIDELSLSKVLNK